MQGSELSEISEESHAHLLVRNPADLTAVKTSLDSTALVGLDLETAAPDAQRLSERERKATALNPRTGRIRLLTVDIDTTDTSRFVYTLDCIRIDPRPLFEELAERKVVGHNLAFDLRFLDRLGFVPGEVHCTMLQAQILTAGTREKVSLAACVHRELDRGVDKTEQTGDWSGSLTPAQLDYAAEDARVLAPLYATQAARLKEADLERVYDVERRCLPAVVWMASKGVKFDQDAWLALAGEAEAEATAVCDRLDALVPAAARTNLLGTNWNSPEQVKSAFAALGVEMTSTDDEHLAAVKHPLARLLRDYRAARKRCTTYGADWLKHVAPDGRVYAGWRQIGADSGRMACREPNLQNLPRDPRYRRCFVASPARVLVKADYSQVELRIAAKIAADERMVEAYRRGDDLHTLTARTILDKEAVSKGDQQLAKAVNFGLLYGMGARGFRIYARTQYGVELTEQQAQEYRAAFFRAYPGLARWHRSIPKPAIETRTLMGRRRLNVERFTEKLNTPVQGTGADGLKMALALLWERRAEAPGAFPVLAVHDEIVVECDRDQARAVEAWLRQAMIEGMAPLIYPVPVEVEATVGGTWGG
jgi:DNA polymerase-1